MYMRNNLQAFPGDVLPLVTSLFNPAGGGSAPAGGAATPLTPGGNINVSPTVQAQVSPQISPVFQQQFQPKGSPATAGTQQFQPTTQSARYQPGTPFDRAYTAPGSGPGGALPTGGGYPPFPVQQPETDWFARYLPYIIAGGLIIGGIWLYGRRRPTRQGQLMNNKPAKKKRKHRRRRKSSKSRKK